MNNNIKSKGSSTDTCGTQFIWFSILLCEPILTFDYESPSSCTLIKQRLFN